MIGMSVRVIALSLPFLLIAFGFHSKEILSQQKNNVVVVPEKGAKKPKREFVDVERCIDCHQNDQEKLKNPDFKQEARKMVRLDEVNEWWLHDLHRKAFANIKPSKEGGPDGGPNLAQRMEDILKTSPSRIEKLAQGETYQVSRAAECLACHAVDTSWKPTEGKSDEITPHLLDVSDNPRFDIRYGVSCEACHGIVGKQWGLDHAEVEWRAHSPQFKAEQGQLDLRDMKVRGERCASCHVGNRAESKFVTHEMYAAGHPPLPTFELATYGRDEPAHYYPARANPYFKEELAKPDGKKNVESRFHYRPDESDIVRSIAFGSVVNLRSNLDLFEKDAATGKLLDFAHFDCAACHHDLKSPSDRQNRKGGITGRPMMKAQTELLDVVLGHAASPKGDQKLDPQWVKLHETFRNELKTLQDAFTARPFGDSAKIQAAAKALNATTETILKELKPIVYDRDTSLALYNAIRKRLESYLPDGQAKADYLDHDSAQQLAWALLSLHRELSEMGQKEDPGWKKAEENLAKTISLVLREPYVDKEPLASVESRLKKRLEKQYDFRTDDFFKAVKALPK